MNYSSQYLHHVYYCAELLSPQVLEKVIDLLTHAETEDMDWLTVQIAIQLPNPSFRRAITDLLQFWGQDSENYSFHTLAVSLDSAAYAIRQHRQSLQVDLVWTGPEGSALPIRQTAQVLLELIERTQKELTLISFAVYKIPEITQALTDALARDVKLRIVAETPESSDGKIGFGVLSTLGKTILEKAEIFIWPKAQRPIDQKGQYGSLHIKAAIADGEYLFITSANLTEYALTLNMELGVIIHNRKLAYQVNHQIEQLIHQGILTKLT